MAKKVEPVKDKAKKAAPAKGKAVPAEKPAVKEQKKAVAVAKAPVEKKVEPKKAAKPAKPSKESEVPVKAQKAVAGDDIRSTLLKRREDLLKEIVGNRERESDPLKKEIGDIYDEASSERERELSLTLGDRDRQKLIEIDEALQRLEKGEYGICESCGENIAPGRLKAQPFARLCINCKAEEERQEARQKKFEAEGVYRTLNYAEEEEG